jgi:hypothetical protein
MTTIGQRRWKLQARIANAQQEQKPGTNAIFELWLCWQEETALSTALKT